MSCPYYKRVVLDRRQQKFYDKYILIGLARNDISGIQVYLHYFCSIYNRKFLKSQDKDYSKFNQVSSYFFQKFTRIVLLRTLIGKNLQETNICLYIALDILGVDSKKDKVKDKDKMPETEKLKQGLIKHLQNIYTKEYRKFYKSQSKSYSGEALEIENQIKNILKEVHQRIDNPIQFEKIKEQEQILPQLIDDKQKIREIKRNFESICNIQILRKSYKQQILQKFCIANKNYFSVTFQILMKSKFSANPNTIILPKYTLETTPVLMKLQPYTCCFPKQKDSSKICAEISRGIAKNCLNYHRKTYSFYPYLSLGDIFIDQKKIASVLSYRPLILDALGLNGNIKNFILRIATEPTPNAINYEKYFKEFDQKSRILLNRKYYQPNYLKDQSHYDIHQNMVKNMNQEDEIAMQKQIAHQVHTWRLINIIYYIHKGRHLGQDFYDGKIEYKKYKKAFYLDEYILQLKRASTLLIKGKLKLSKIIPAQKLDNQPEEKQQNSQQIQQNQLNFQYLMRYLNIEDNQDSLFENLRWEKLRHQLYNRQTLNKGVLDLVVNSDYSFKKLPNPIKYFFIYYHHQLESIQQVRLKREAYLSLFKLEGIRSQLGRQVELITQLSKEVNKVSLMRQKEKREMGIKDAESKLYQYSQRKGKPQQQYVDKNGRIQMVQYINKQIQGLQEFRNFQSMIMEVNSYKLPELRGTLKNLIEKDINIRKQIKQRLGNLYSFLCKNSVDQIKTIQILQKLQQIKHFVRNEVQNRLMEIISLLKTKIQNIVKEIKGQPSCHAYSKQKDMNQKQNQELNKQLTRYFNNKLDLLMLCLFNQKQEYWKQYQLLLNYQTEQNIKKGNISMKDIQKETEIQEIILLSWKQKQQKNLQKQ